MGRVDAIVDGGICGVGLESTVISLAGEVPTVLRPGGITVEQLRKVLGDVQVDPAAVSYTHLRKGIGLIVRSTDPNLTAEKIAQVYDLPVEMVHVLSLIHI